jgi:Protein of unknown function (DUF1350)
MNWQEISGNWVWIPRQPLGIIHFLGGAFVATAPNVTYRWLLENLGSAGYAIVATPFVNTLDHRSIARSVLNRFDTLLDRLRARHLLPRGYLPIYGIGHSMGCKLHLLIGSLYEVERSGNILISFNNYPVRRAIPFIEPLQIDTTFNIEFTPSPEETNEIIYQDYAVRRNLLIRFQDDSIDQTLSLNPLLKKRFNDLIAMRILPGNHLTPLSQDIDWQTGEIFTPFDAIGQWLKQGLSRDNSRLKEEILTWLDPVRSVGC